MPDDGGSTEEESRSPRACVTSTCQAWKMSACGATWQATGDGRRVRKSIAGCYLPPGDSRWRCLGNGLTVGVGVCKTMGLRRHEVSGQGSNRVVLPRK
jgi:hypothetical protein